MTDTLVEMAPPQPAGNTFCLQRGDTDDEEIFYGPNRSKRTNITSTPSPGLDLEDLLNQKERLSILESFADLARSCPPLSPKLAADPKRSKVAVEDDILCACGDKVAKLIFAQHVDQYCVEKIVTCDFNPHGCYFSCRRGDMPRHHAAAAAVHSKLLCDQLAIVKHFIDKPLLETSWSVLPSISLCVSSNFEVFMQVAAIHLFLSACNVDGVLSVYLNRSDGCGGGSIDVAGSFIVICNITRTFPPDSLLEPGSGIGFDFPIEDVSRKVTINLFFKAKSAGVLILE